MTAVGALRMENGITPGEASGLFAGVVAFVYSLGKGLAWLLDWQGARTDKREASLRSAEEALWKREHEYQQQLEARLSAMEAKLADVKKAHAEDLGKLSRVTEALFECWAELHRYAPASPILVQARVALRDAFPVEPEMPEEIRALLRRIDSEGDKP